MNKNYSINEEIKCKKIRISGEKELLSYSEAMERANNEDVDLIQIGQSGDIAICVLEVLSKYIYKQKKKDKESAKTKTKPGLKEIKIGLNIGEHDINHKAKKAIEIMEEGSRVKVSLFLSGREIMRADEGIETVEKFIEKCMPCTYDRQPKLDGKIISAVIFKK